MWLLASFRKVPAMVQAVLDMPPGEFFTLSAITGMADTRGPEGEVYVSELRQGAHMSLPAVSQALSSLEAKGYVVRGKSQRDKRRVLVQATPEGRAFLHDAMARTGGLSQEAVSKFGEQSTAQLMELVSRFVKVIEEIHEARGGAPIELEHHCQRR